MWAKDGKTIIRTFTMFPNGNEISEEFKGNMKMLIVEKMKNKKPSFALISILFISTFSFSQAVVEEVDLIEPNVQEIDGTWSWSSEDGTNNFELTLYEISGNLSGRHCSVFHNGTKIDCVDKNISIKLSETSNNIFEGTIKSGFSNSIGRIKLKFSPVTKKLYFYLIEEPSGINYIPKELILEQ